MRHLTWLLVLGLTAAGCGNDPLPIDPSPTFQARTELFTGQLAPSGTSFYSFTVVQAGIVRLTLASLTSPGAHAAQTTAVGFGFGVPSGTGCKLTTSAPSSPALAPQFRAALALGTYCVSIFDAGGLAAPLDFAIRIVHSGEPASVGSAATQVFESALIAGGASSRSFSASEAGTVTVTLTSAGPAGTRVGLGVGIPRLEGGGCMLSRSIETTAGAGPHLTLAVERGSHCVKLFDVGTVVGSVNFSMRIVNP